MRNLLFCIVAFSISSIAFNQKLAKIAFYNTENFFDTIDGTNDDAEYLPSSKLKWDNVKYNEKIKHVSEVINSLNYPIIMGFCEIENEGVLNDLIKSNKKLKCYKTVHYESPDARGIDVGFIYNASKMKVLKRYGLLMKY